MRRIIFFIVISVSFLCKEASGQFLVESFRNMNCVPCKQADAQYDALLAAHPEYKAILIYIHTSFPANDDPFYLASKNDESFRESKSFYGVPSDPDLFVNGFDGGSGIQSFNNWKNLTASTAALSAAGTLYSGTMATSAFVDAKDTLHANFHVNGTTVGKQVRLYAMVVESGIKYFNAKYPDGYGTPADSTWNNIFRAMIPAAQGSDPFVLSGAADYHYKYYIAGKPWNLKNCKIVAFLQEVAPQSDNASRNIDAFDTAMIVLPSAVSLTPQNPLSSLLAPIPNPSQSFAKIPFHLAAPANVKIVISDDFGREISTVVNEFISDIQSSAIFYPSHLSSGIYYARMYADGQFIGTQKIVFAP